MIEVRGDLSTRPSVDALAHGMRMIAYEVTERGEPEAKDVERSGLSFTWKAEEAESG